MDSSTAIGNVTTYYLETTDALGNNVETNISKGFTVNANATYADVDETSRALTNLSRDSYVDTILVTKISVNEVMAE